ncbi:BMC domain protein [Planctomycetes bacterium Poly30]|uniref:BMC domain protein n=1 Tax=Saltatorellus ferox TaxID=2528018 RepID=A0A518EQZ0_9BACT|nr:BMC domain protein [Planctomycetes bacterium Poly30]
MTKNDYNPTIGSAVIQPAIAMLETQSVAAGIEMTDAILWESDIELLFATHVQPGKYVVLFTGSIDALRSALRRGVEVARGDLVDQLLIPQIDPRVCEALRRRDEPLSPADGELDAVGVIETTTVSSCIAAADIALKEANVELLELRIANGLGGKSYVSMTGEVSDVRSSIQAGARHAESSARLARHVVIAKPHPELVAYL